jgi:MoaA/NifB/PqqE/SkfB family radical SAM enzyme
MSKIVPDPVDTLDAFRDAALADRGYAVRPPVNVFLEVASVCNLACSMCKLSSADYRKRQPRFIPVATVERLLRGLPKGVELIVLNGLGEPLLHPQFPDLVRLCKTIYPAAMTSINTNASFLARRAGEVVACGLDELYVSINSANPAQFAASRDGASLADVVAGIRALHAARAACGADRPVVKMRAVAIRGTDYADLLRLAADLSITTIGVQELCLDGDWIGDAARALKPDPAEEQWVVEQFPAVAAQTGVAIEIFWPSRELPFVCRSPWETLNVLSDGSVTPCCVLSHPPSGVVGRTDESSSNELWNGDPMREFRQRFVCGEEPACCGCPLYRAWERNAGAETRT